MGKAELAWTPVKGNDLYKHRKDFTHRPSHPGWYQAWGTKGIVYECPRSTSAWLKVLLLGFLFRDIKLNLSKNITYLVQGRKIGFRFRVSVQMQNKL